MLSLREIGKRAGSLILRLGVISRTHPQRAAFVGAGLICATATALFWRTLRDKIPMWSRGFGKQALLLPQAHPHLARLLHVVLNAVPDAVPLLLGVAGLVYLMPDQAKKIEKSKPLRWFFATICFFFMFLAIAVNAINREAQDHKSQEQDDKIGAVQETNNTILQAILNPTSDISEVGRHKRIEESLRNEYILANDPIDPQILAGNEMPPAQWMNKRLADLGEKWTVSDPPRSKSQVVIQQNPPTIEKQAAIVFSFSKDQMISRDKIVTNTEAPMFNGEFEVAISAINIGETPAENVNIWFRACTECQWTSAPATFTQPDPTETSDRGTFIPELLPNVSSPHWTFKIARAGLAKLSSLGIGAYYACKNCPPVDWNKPQRLVVSAPNLPFKLPHPSISYTPGRVPK